MAANASGSPDGRCLVDDRAPPRRRQRTKVSRAGTTGARERLQNRTRRRLVRRLPGVVNVSSPLHSCYGYYAATQTHKQNERRSRMDLCDNNNGV